MAEIVPFRGILFDTARVSASAVLAPPYDVIDSDGRDALAAKDPHNSVRLILPVDEAGGNSDARYEVAGRTLEAWLADGTLVRDQRPALYRYHQIFSSAELGGAHVVRRGFIASVRLHRFDEMIILRHELTLKGPKIDRLKLWDRTSTHLSQIFTLYSDPSGETDRVFVPIEKTPPVIDGTTDDGTRHLVWRVTDAEVIGTVQRMLAPQKLYIADGHHRYETMLALRDRMRERAGGSLDSDSTGEFGTLFLANMDDPGLVVLPTHRLVHSVADFDRARLIAGVSEFFDVRMASGAAASTAAIRAVLADAGKSGPSFAMVFPPQGTGREDDDAHILTLRPDFDASRAGLELPAVLSQLDVTLLHGVVFEHLLGIDKAAQEAKSNLIYFKDAARALDSRGDGQVLFVMNATPVHQVKAVSDAGEVMPQKSTFFYPKIASGVVFNRIDPSESIP